MFQIWKGSVQWLLRYKCSKKLCHKTYKNSPEGVITPAGAKVTGATIRMWLLNKIISFLAVLSWKTGLKKMRTKCLVWHIYSRPVPFPLMAISSALTFRIIQPNDNVDVKCVKVIGAWNIGQGHRSKYLLIQYIKEKHYARYGGCRPYSWGVIKHQCKMCQI